VGDKIAVMHEGLVHQVDTPHNVYHRPANLFVGAFIGLPPINRFSCALQQSGGTLALASNRFSLPLPEAIASRLTGASSRITLGVRPEFMAMGADGAIGGAIKLIEMMGSRTLVLLDSDGDEIRVLVQGAPPVREGDRVGVTPELSRAFYFDEDGRNLLL
ncbi:MAG: TOBE domain-containing protein, partial [Geminicoccaceae bacterium]